MLYTKPTHSKDCKSLCHLVGSKNTVDIQPATQDAAFLQDSVAATNKLNRTRMVKSLLLITHKLFTRKFEQIQ